MLYQILHMKFIIQTNKWKGKLNLTFILISLKLYSINLLIFLVVINYNNYIKIHFFLHIKPFQFSITVIEIRTKTRINQLVKSLLFCLHKVITNQIIDHVQVCTSLYNFIVQILRYSNKI